MRCEEAGVFFPFFLAGFSFPKASALYLETSYSDSAKARHEETTFTVLDFASCWILEVYHDSLLELLKSEKTIQGYVYIRLCCRPVCFFCP